MHSRETMTHTRRETHIRRIFSERFGTVKVYAIYRGRTYKTLTVFARYRNWCAKSRIEQYDFHRIRAFSTRRVSHPGCRGERVHPRRSTGHTIPCGYAHTFSYLFRAWALWGMLANFLVWPIATRDIANGLSHLSWRSAESRSRARARRHSHLSGFRFRWLICTRIRTSFPLARSSAFPSAFTSAGRSFSISSPGKAAL